MESLKQLFERRGPIFWSGLAGIVPRVAILAASIYVARSCGEAAFARYSLALSTILVAGNFVGASLATTITRYLPLVAGPSAANPESGRGSLALLSMVLAAALSAIVGLLAPFLAALFAMAPEDAMLFRVAAPVTLFIIAQGAAMGFVTGAARFRAAALINLSAFVAFAGALWLLVPRYEAAGGLAAIGVFYAASLLLAQVTRSLPTYRAVWQSARDGSWRALRGVLAYFLPLLIATGLISPVTWICNLLLARWGGGHVEVAAFNAAYTWFAVAAYAPAVLAQVEFVNITRLVAERGRHSLNGAVRRFRWGNIATMLPLVLILGAFAEPLARVFGIDAPQAATSLRLLLGAAFLMSVGDPARLFLSATGRVWAACFVNAAWGVSVLVLAFALKSQGAVGIGYAYLVGYGAYVLVGAWCLRRCLVRSPM